MLVHQFILEARTRDGCYEHKEFVLVQDDAIASRFAREFARHWRPDSTYDAELDIYSAPEGWPQWTLAQCKPVTHLIVPVAGQWSNRRVALIPESEVTS
jgi:hypothetical protein